MAEDRGGLQYAIQVRDEFSKSTILFREEIAASKASFLDFIAGVGRVTAVAEGLKDAAKAAKDLATANQQLSNATKSQAAQDKEALAVLRQQREEKRIAAQAFREQEAEIKRSNAARIADEKAAAAQSRAIDKARLDQIKETEAAQTAALRNLAEQSRAQAAKESEFARIKRQLERDDAAAQAQIARAQKVADAERKAQLKAEQLELKRVVDAQNERAKTAQKLEAARQRDEAAELTSQQKNLQAFIKAQAQREATAAKIFKTQTADKAAATPPIITTIPPESISRVQQLRDLLKSSGSEGNSLLFTFRRLVGVFAVFAAARLGFQAFINTIKEGVKFNAQIEQSQLGIASLITAVGELRDEFGHTLDPVNALTAAQKIAGEQTRKLRQDALNTIAPFEELQEAFQQAIGPGLASGLNIDQIRQVTVSITKAAAALGVEQSQAIRETREILQGTITQRSRIGPSLGISPQDIKNAKEQGTLFDLLNKKFAAFEVTGEKVTGTFDGIVARIKNVFSFVLGESAQGLFGELTSLGQKLFSQVLSVKDKFGQIKPNPALVAGIQEIFDVLRILLHDAVEVGKALGFKGARDGLSAFASGLLFVGEAIIGITRGIVSIFLTVSSFFRSLSDSVGLTTGDLGKLIAAIFAIGVPIAAAGKGFVAMARYALQAYDFLLPFSPLLKQLTGYAAKFGEVFAGSAAHSGEAIVQAILGPLETVGIALAVVGFSFNKILESIFGVNLSLSDTVGLLKAGFLDYAARAAEALDLVIVSVEAFGEKLVVRLVSFATTSFLKAKAALFQLVGNESGANQAILDAEESAKKSADKLEAIELDKQQHLNSIQSKALDFRRKQSDSINDIIGKAAAKDTLGPGFNVPKFDFSKFQKSTHEFTVEASDLPPILSAIGEEISKSDAELKTLTDDARKAGEEFREAFGHPIVSGAVGQIDQLFRQAGVEALEKSKELQTRLKSIKDEIKTAQQPQAFQTDEEERRNAQLILSLKRDQSLVEEQIAKFRKAAFDTATSKAATAALVETNQLRQSNELLKSQVATQQVLANVQRSRLTTAEAAVFQTAADIQKAAIETAQKREQLRIEIGILQARSVGAQGKEKEALDGLVHTLQTKLSLETQSSDAQRQQLEFAHAQAELVAHGNITEGIHEGLIQLASELPTLFQAGINIIKSSVQSISGALSSAIVDGFNGGDVRQAAGQLLQGIAKTILDQVFQASIGQLLQNALGLDTGAAAVEASALALGVAGDSLFAGAAAISAAALQLSAANATSSLGAGSLFSTGLLPFAGVATGGTIPATARMSLAHATARGYAQGGGIDVGRPRGLDRRDTTPIWAQPGEFMMRLSAVRKYGAGVMQRINAGFADPSSLAAVTGNTMSMSSAPTAGAGAANGGLISERAAGSGQQSNGNHGSNGIGISAIVSSPAALDKLVSGGRPAMLRFFKQNRGDLKSALGLS